MVSADFSAASGARTGHSLLLIPYAASLMLNSVTSGPQVGKFPNEVISEQQPFSGVEIEMTLVVQVQAPGRIDEASARSVLENSGALKVEKPDLY
jgi:hypothetical protein